MNITFRKWISPLVSPLNGVWGACFNDLTPEQKQQYRDLKHYFDVMGDSEFPDAVAYLNRNKFTYKLRHFWKGGNH